jgi:hypothetical protein
VHIVQGKNGLLPEGFEPTTPDSKSGVLTTTLWERVLPSKNRAIRTKNLCNESVWKGQ